MKAVNIARRQLLCMAHQILFNATAKRGLYVYNAHQQRMVTHSGYLFHACYFSTAKQTYLKSTAKQTDLKHSEDRNKRKKENKPDSKQQSRKKEDVDREVRLFDVSGLLIGEMKYQKACDRAKAENLTLEKLGASEKSPKHQIDAYQFVQITKSKKKTEKIINFTEKMEKHGITTNMNKIRASLKKNYNVIVNIGSKNSTREQTPEQVRKIEKLIQAELKDVAQVTSASSMKTFSKLTLKPQSKTNDQTPSSASTTDSEDRAGCAPKGMSAIDETVCNTLEMDSASLQEIGDEINSTSISQEDSKSYNGSVWEDRSNVFTTAGVRIPDESAQCMKNLPDATPVSDAEVSVLSDSSDLPVLQRHSVSMGYISTQFVKDDSHFRKFSIQILEKELENWKLKNRLMRMEIERKFKTQ